MSSPTLTFTPAMFHASLAGTKDTTRRLVTPQPVETPGDGWTYYHRNGDVPYGIGMGYAWSGHAPGQIKPMVTSWRINGSLDDPKPSDLDPQLVRDLGDIYWEYVGTLHPFSHHIHNATKTPTCQIHPGRYSHESKLYPARFLPKHLYPLAPKVKILTVTPEFLHDITEDSALRDGIQHIGGKFGVPDVHGDFIHQASTAREAYFKLWDSIYAKRDGGKYAAQNNPACWTITYQILP